MRFTLTIVHAGFLTLSVAALAPPSLAQTGAPADSSNPATGRDFPAYLAPGALVPPDLAGGEAHLPFHPVLRHHHLHSVLDLATLRDRQKARYGDLSSRRAREDSFQGNVIRIEGVVVAGPQIHA